MCAQYLSFSIHSYLKWGSTTRPLSVWIWLPFQATFCLDLVTIILLSIVFWDYVIWQIFNLLMLYQLYYPNTYIEVGKIRYVLTPLSIFWIWLKCVYLKCASLMYIHSFPQWIKQHIPCDIVTWEVSIWKLKMSSSSSLAALVEVWSWSVSSPVNPIVIWYPPCR